VPAQAPAPAQAPTPAQTPASAQAQTPASAQAQAPASALAQAPASECIVGACGFRGGRIPVVDLNRRFRLGETEATAQAKIIISDAGGAQLGFAVNRVVEIAQFSGDALRPVPACAATEDNRRYLAGVLLAGERPALFIDMGGILGEAELRACIAARQG
jgi:chemotaxis signal transduction protein